MGFKSNFTPAVDDVSIENAGGVLRVKDGGIDFTKLGDRNLTTNGSDPGLGGISLSSSSGNFFSVTTSRTTLPNVQATLTTGGGLVHMRLVPNEGSSIFPRWGYRQSGAVNTPGNTCYFHNVGLGTDIYRTGGNFRNDTGGNIECYSPIGGFGGWAQLPAGTHTIRVDAQFSSGAGSHTILCQHIRLLLLEEKT